MEEKVDKITHDDKAEELQLWMDEVKQINDKMRSYHKDAICEFEAWSHAQRNVQQTCDNHLADLSCHANTFPSNFPVSSSLVKCSYPPNLTDAECTLLRDNKGCFNVVVYLRGSVKL